MLFDYNNVHALPLYASQHIAWVGDLVTIKPLHQESWYLHARNS